MNAVSQQIPPGYRRNPQGHLVPEELISPLQKQNDELVRDIVAKARELQQKMHDFKRRAMNDIYAHVQLVGEKYDAKIGGAKGNISIRSFDGTMTVEIATANVLFPGPEIHAAKALIDGCLHKWTADSRPEVRAVIDRTFRTDKEGRFNVGRLLELTKMEIDDADWKSAMQALTDAMQVGSTRTYLEVSERPSADRKFERVQLNLAEL